MLNRHTQYTHTQTYTKKHSKNHKPEEQFNELHTYDLHMRHCLYM